MTKRRGSEREREGNMIEGGGEKMEETWKWGRD